MRIRILTLRTGLCPLLLFLTDFRQVFQLSKLFCTCKLGMMIAYSVVMFEGEIGDGEVIEGLVTAQLHICHGLWVQGGDLLRGSCLRLWWSGISRKLEASRAETMAHINACRWL